MSAGKDIMCLGLVNKALLSIDRIESTSLSATVLKCANYELKRVANYMSFDLRRIFVGPRLSASYSTRMSLVGE